MLNLINKYLNEDGNIILYHVSNPLFREKIIFLHRVKSIKHLGRTNNFAPRCDADRSFINSIEFYAITLPNHQVSGQSNIV